MKGIKKTAFVISGLILIQVLTFYTIGESSIIEQVGENHESFVLNYPENKFTDIAVVSKIKPSLEKVKTHFNQLNPYDIKIYSSLADCSDFKKKDSLYLYSFDFINKSPFTINTLKEAEFSKGYGASWNSKYIWVLFRWVLIEKSNTGIS